MSTKELSQEQTEELINTLQVRFEKNTSRHEGLDWANVQARLEANREKLWSLHEMEATGGEPDVVGYDANTDEFIFMIVLRKVLKVAEVYVMTVKHGNLEKSQA